MKKFILAFALILLAICTSIAGATPVDAHTPEVSADCDGLYIELTNYEGPRYEDSVNNDVIIHMNDVEINVIPFAESLTVAIPWPDDVTPDTWKVVIDANITRGDATKYDKTIKGKVKDCTPKKIDICHRDQGKPEWKIISISVNALDAHLNHQWGEDIYPVPADGCPVTDTVPPTTEPPVTVPPTTEPPCDPSVSFCGPIDGPGVIFPNPVPCDGYYATYEDYLAQNGNCVPEDPCSGLRTMWHFQPCVVETVVPNVVETTTVAPAATSAGTLPATGTNTTAWIVVIAGLLIGLGGAANYFMRNRKSV